MDKLDNNVYQLGIGDYYLYIDYNGYRYLYAVSTDLNSLIRSARNYARKYLPIGVPYGLTVINRSAFGAPPTLSYCDP